MEQGHHRVHISSVWVIGRLNLNTDPFGRRQLLVPIDILGLLNLHASAHGNWIKVKHDGLLAEAETTVRFRYHSVDVLVHRLFHIQDVAVYFVYVLRDLTQRIESLFQLQARPPVLETKGCSGFDNLVGWQVGFGLLLAVQAHS